MDARVGYVHMNGPDADKIGALYANYKDLLNAVAGMVGFVTPIKEANGGFPADPESYQVGIVSVEDREKLDDLMDHGADGDDFNSFKPCVQGLTKKQLIGAEDEMCAKEQWSRGLLYFDGQVMTPAEVVYEIVTRYDPSAPMKVYPISVAAAFGRPPFFWGKRSSIRVFEKNPDRFPGWEELVAAGIDLQNTESNSA